MTRFPILLLLLAVISCTDENMVFQIGEDNIDVNTHIRFVDTLTVHSYTVMMDSVKTSGLTSPAVVVGYYNDEDLGTLTANGYFRVTLPSSLTLSDSAIFDSLWLYITPNGYYSGDTLAPFNLVVHRLMEDMKPNDDGHFYNNDYIAAMPEVLGEKTYLPEPHSGDSIWTMLDSISGQELFDLIVEKDEIIKDNESFMKYFKGFKLTYTESNQAILGFQFASVGGEGKKPGMRLYYHYKNSSIQRYFDFPAQQGSYTSGHDTQFNEFSLTDPLVDFPDRQRDKLYAGETENKTYLLAGLGIVTRIEIPYLKNLLEIHNNVKILDAQLELQPARNTYNEILLPEALNIYSSNNRNSFVTAIYDKYNDPQNGNLVIDKLYQEETWYTFDITNFLKLKLQEETDESPSLLISVATDNLNKTLERALLGSQINMENPVRLKLYYMHYE